MLFKKKIKPITLETKRFTLKRVPADQLARKTFAWTNDVELMHMLGMPGSGWTHKKWLKTFKPLRGENGICWAIYPNGSDNLIGYQSVHILKDGPGYLTVVIKDRNWWGKQVVMETRSAICDYMFTQTLCPRLYGIPLARNMPSVFNYQSLGFKVEGIMRNHVMDYKRGEMVDVVIFGLLREEWINRQKTEPAADGQPNV